MFDVLSINRENFVTLFKSIQDGDVIHFDRYLLHHIVVMPEIKLENLAPTIAILEYCGCDFYHEENSDGKAACYLAARRAESYSLFSQIKYYRKLIHKLVNCTCSLKGEGDVLCRCECEIFADG